MITTLLKMSYPRGVETSGRRSTKRRSNKNEIFYVHVAVSMDGLWVSQECQEKRISNISSMSFIELTPVRIKICTAVVLESDKWERLPILFLV